MIKPKKITQTTVSGKVINILDPEIELIDIVDVAWSLSMQCRYNGHLYNFYSIGQHSCLVSDILPDELKLQGLLHDSAEYIVGDLISPIKHLLQLEYFTKLEDHILYKIGKKFKIGMTNLDKRVRDADIAIRNAEKEDLRGEIVGPRSHIPKITPWSQAYSYYQFMARFYKLYANHINAR